MKVQDRPEEAFAPPQMAARTFFCCCPIVIPLLPFFALHWMVLKIAGKLQE
jgi:hypothetical protein